MGQRLRGGMKGLLTVAAIGNGILFVGLNGVDGWLTERLLAIGGVEGNRMSIFYPALEIGAIDFNLIIVKALLALAIVVALICFGKAKLLWLLSIGMSVVVLVNSINILTYLAGFYNWF